MKLILLRGLPGSGKSTLAKTLSRLFATAHIEADQFFTDSTGKYTFEPMHISEAHEWCQERTRLYLADGFNVIVSNTSTTEKEVKVYQDMADEYGAEFISLIVENRHGNSSVHDVPDHIMITMENRFSIKL